MPEAILFGFQGQIHERVLTTKDKERSSYKERLGGWVWTAQTGWAVNHILM